MVVTESTPHGYNLNMETGFHGEYHIDNDVSHDAPDQDTDTERVGQPRMRIRGNCREGMKHFTSRFLHACAGLKQSQQKHETAIRRPDFT